MIRKLGNQEITGIHSYYIISSDDTEEAGSSRLALLGQIYLVITELGVLAASWPTE